MPRKNWESDEARRSYNRKAMARWRADHPEKVEAGREAAAQRTAEWRANLTSEELAAHREYTAKWRAEFKERDPEGWKEYNRRASMAYRHELKHRLIEAYGGFCTCCGLVIEEFLTFDHMDGNGRRHRQENRLTAGGAWFLWLWNGGELRKRIRLYCFNCNCSKGFLGYCPHERMRV